MRLLLLYSILTCLISCSRNDTKNTTDFKTIVPDTALGQFDDLEFGKWRSEWLNLHQIYRGVDSFELRIWNFGIWSPMELIVLRYFDNKWIECGYRYQQNGKRVIDSLVVTCKQIDPSIAVEVQNYLTQDSILMLPSQTAIPNFKDNTADGDTYFIEIATNKFYKTLGYHNPTFFKDPYNKRFLQLIRFLQDRFKFFHTD